MAWLRHLWGFRPRFVRIVRHGEMIPNWYGIGWWDFERDRTYCFPIPINVLVAKLGFPIWCYCKHPLRKQMDELWRAQRKLEMAIVEADRRRRRIELLYFGGE